MCLPGGETTDCGLVIGGKCRDHPICPERVANKYSREPIFAWMFEFKQTNGNRISFKRTDLSTYNLQQSQRVKEQIQKENIPLTVGQMDEATKKWYELELDMDKLNPEPFNEFFNNQ